MAPTITFDELYRRLIKRKLFDYSLTEARIPSTGKYFGHYF